MKIQEMPNFKTLEDLYWECSALFLQGKTLLAPLSGDSINGSTYTIDISYSASNLLDKVTAVWRNTNILIGFELLVSLRCLDELRKKMHPDKLTPKLEEKTNQARCPLFIDFDGVDEFEQILLAYQAG
jgi:histidine ammonia-lyase